MMRRVELIQFIHQSETVDVQVWQQFPAFGGLFGLPLLVLFNIDVKSFEDFVLDVDSELSWDLCDNSLPLFAVILHLQGMNLVHSLLKSFVQIQQL